MKANVFISSVYFLGVNSGISVSWHPSQEFYNNNNVYFVRIEIFAYFVEFYFAYIIALSRVRSNYYTRYACLWFWVDRAWLCLRRHCHFPISMIRRRDHCNVVTSDLTSGARLHCWNYKRFLTCPPTEITPAASTNNGVNPCSAAGQADDAIDKLWYFNLTWLKTSHNRFKGNI